MAREGEYQSEMGDRGSWAGVETMMTVAAQHAGRVVLVRAIAIYGLFLWRYGTGGVVEGALEMGG